MKPKTDESVEILIDKKGEHDPEMHSTRVPERITGEASALLAQNVLANSKGSSQA